MNLNNIPNHQHNRIPLNAYIEKNMNFDSTPAIKGEGLNSKSPNNTIEPKCIIEIFKTEIISDDDDMADDAGQLENNSNTNYSPQILITDKDYPKNSNKRKRSTSNTGGGKHSKLTSINLVNDESINSSQTKCLENKFTTIKSNFKLKKSAFKDYRCGVCKKIFNFPQDLAKHAQQNHAKALKYYFQEPNYSCSLCSKSFNRNEHLKRHYYYVHSEEQKINSSVKTTSNGTMKKRINLTSINAGNDLANFSNVKPNFKKSTKSGVIVKTTSNGGMKKRINLTSINAGNENFKKSTKPGVILNSIKLEIVSKQEKGLAQNQLVSGKRFLDNKKNTTSLQNNVDIANSSEDNSTLLEKDTIIERRVLRNRLKQTIIKKEKIATRSCKSPNVKTSKTVDIPERPVQQSRLKQKAHVKDLIIKKEKVATRSRTSCKDKTSRTLDILEGPVQRSRLKQKAHVKDLIIKNEKVATRSNRSRKGNTSRTVKDEKSTITCNTCAICNKTFDYQRELSEHAQQYHPNAKAFKCRDCGDRFTELPKLSHHFRITHNVEKYKCKVCSKTFHIKFNYVRHLKLHEEKRPYPCSQCEKSFNRQDHWKIHQNWHLKQKAINKKKSKNPTTNEATKENAKHICQICSKAFHKSFHLRRHLISHTDQRPFPCSLCEKAYKRQDQWNIHQKWHLKQTKKDEYAVKRVKQRYDDSQKSNKKIKTVATAEKEDGPYRCTQCDKSYKRQMYFKLHEKKHLNMAKIISYKLDLKYNL